MYRAQSAWSSTRSAIRCVSSVISPPALGDHRCTNCGSGALSRGELYSHPSVRASGGSTVNELVRTARDGPLLWVTINRADKRNALSAETLAALESAFRAS